MRKNLRQHGGIRRIDAKRERGRIFGKLSKPKQRLRLHVRVHRRANVQIVRARLLLPDGKVGQERLVAFSNRFSDRRYEAIEFLADDDHVCSPAANSL